MAMRLIGNICLIGSLLIASGCHCSCCGKRASELQCPTDIRQGHAWCFGEDALFHGPCGPKQEFYGHEPTTWRAWPAEADEWRDICGSCQTNAAPNEASFETAYFDDEPVCSPGQEVSPSSLPAYTNAIEGRPTSAIPPTERVQPAEVALPSLTSPQAYGRRKGPLERQDGGRRRHNIGGRELDPKNWTA